METVILKYNSYYYDNGQIESEEYWLDGKLHNPNGYAFKYWYENGQRALEEYYIDGKLHNPNGVAYRNWYENGRIEEESYWIDGNLHNPNGVALKSWCLSGRVWSEEYFLYGEPLSKDKFNQHLSDDFINAFQQSEWFKSTSYSISNKSLKYAKIWDQAISTVALWNKPVVKSKFQARFRNNTIVEVDGVKYKLTAI